MQDSPVRRKHSTSYSGHGSPEPAAGSWSPWSRSSGGGRTTLRSSSASQSLEAGPQPLLLSQGSGRSGRRRSHGPASADALDGYEEEPSLRRHSYNCPEDGYKSDSEGSSSSSSSTLGPEDEELEDEGSDEELEETEGEEGMAPPASRRGASVPIGMPGGPRRPLASSGSAVDWQSMLRARPMPMRPVATAPQGLASQDQADETCEEEEEEASEEELGAGHAETSAQEEEEDEEALATAYSSPYDSASPGTSPKRAAVLLAPKPPRPPSHLKPHAASSTAACKPAAAAGALPVPQPRHQHNHSAPQALSTASDLLAPELSASPGSQAGSPMQPGLASAAAAAGAGSPAANGERCPASSAEAGKSPEAKGMASKASPPGKTGNSISFSSISEWPPESTSSQLLRDAPDMRAHVQPQELTPPRPLPPALVPSEAEPRCSAAAAAAAAVSAAVPPRMLDTASAAVAAMASAGAAAAAALQKQEAEQRAARSQAADAMALAPVQQPGALVPAALASPASTASGALTPRTFVPVRMAMGTYSDKGPREKMEDFVFALPLPKPGSAASDAAAEAGLPSSGACSFTHAVCFGVFDGHNGASTAKDLAEKVPVGLKEGVAHIAAHGPSHMGDILAGHERRLRHQRHYGHHHRHHGHHHHGHHHGGSGSGNGHAHIQHHGHPRVQVHPLRPHVHLALPHGPHSNGHAHARVHAHVVAEPCPARAVSMPGDMPCNSAQAALDSAGSAPLPLPAPEPPSQEGLRQLQVQVPEAGEQGWERGAQGQADEPQLVSSPGSLGPLTHALHHAHTSSWTDSDYACASSSVPASPAPGMVNGAQEVRPALPWAVPLPQGAAGGDGFSYGTAAVGNGNGHVDVPTDSEQPGSSNGVGGNHGPVEEDDSGSTALVAAVIDGSVFVANIGDCRLILAGEALFMFRLLKTTHCAGTRPIASSEHA